MRKLIITQIPCPIAKLFFQDGSKVIRRFYENLINIVFDFKRQICFYAFGMR